MTYIMTASVLATFVVVGLANAETHHEKAGHNARTETYQQASSKVTADKAPVKTADGKRLPGRDCKLNEGGVRQHRFGQYEIGNPSRPECPAA